MAVYTEDIRRAAVALGAHESEVLEGICAAAEEHFTAKLRSGVHAEECRSVLVTAAAMLAAATVATAETAGGAVSYSAGAVSVKTGSGRDAEMLKKQAESLMAPYVSDEGFVFAGVRGR